MFELKLRGPEDAQLLQSIELEIAQQFQEDRASLRAAARQRIAEVQEENRRTFDRKCKEATKYEEEDLVAIKGTQQGPGLKLFIKFLGPYRIIKCDPHDRYAVKKVGNGEGPNETTTSANNINSHGKVFVMISRKTPRLTTIPATTKAQMRKQLINNP